MNVVLHESGRIMLDPGFGDPKIFMSEREAYQLGVALLRELNVLKFRKELESQ